MSKPLDKRVKKILEELEFDPKECLWDCHGTPVMYHKFCEIAGAKRGVEYELYDIERNSEKGIVCIKCVATVTNEYNQQKTSVSTYGEASPKNNKNAYPYAMAEKRSVDRAILKLLGLHGFIYSEDELDASQFKGEKEKEETNKHPLQETYEGLSDEEQETCKQLANSVVDLVAEGRDQDALNKVANIANDLKEGVKHVLFLYTGDNKISNKLKRLKQENAMRNIK